MVAQDEVNESLTALERHMHVAAVVLSLCRSANGKLSSGMDPDCIMKDVTSFWNRIDAMINQDGDDPSNEEESKQLSLISSAKHFTGQVFVLPMSITLNNGLNPKCATVVLEYGLASTTFEGPMFNGKYSRILLETNATEFPKLSLSYKKRYSFGSRAKRPIAEARTVKISYSHKDECFEVTVLFSKQEQDVGQVTFLVEWYPKVN